MRQGNGVKYGMEGELVGYTERDVRGFVGFG